MIKCLSFCFPIAVASLPCSSAVCISELCEARRHIQRYSDAHKHTGTQAAMHNYLLCEGGINFHATTGLSLDSIRQILH